MFAALPFEKETPYWRAVPRSEVQELPVLLPTFCEVPVTVSCFGWLVLKITVLAAVVAEDTVFSPMLVGAKRYYQPFLASRSACASACVANGVVQSEASCRQPLVISERSLSPMTAGGLLGEVTSAGASVPVFTSLIM